MIARAWTVEELDRVHPLPKADGKRHRYPWAWRLDDRTPVAHEVGPAEPDEVWVDSSGRVASGDGEPPDDVALAVILASQGRDSFEALAEVMSRRAHRAEMKAERAGSCTEAEMEWCIRQETWSKASAMLRRGRQAAESLRDALVTSFTENPIEELGTNDQIELMKCLGRLDADEIVDQVTLGIVRRCLSSSSIQMRDAAVCAVERWGCAEAFALLRNHSEPTPWLQSYISQILAESGSPSQVPPGGTMTPEEPQAPSVSDLQAQFAAKQRWIGARNEMRDAIRGLLVAEQRDLLLELLAELMPGIGRLPSTEVSVEPSDQVHAQALLRLVAAGIFCEPCPTPWTVERFDNFKGPGTEHAWQLRSSNGSCLDYLPASIDGPGFVAWVNASVAVPYSEIAAGSENSEIQS